MLTPWRVCLHQGTIKFHNWPITLLTRQKQLCLFRNLLSGHTMSIDREQYMHPHCFIEHNSKFFGISHLTDYTVDITDRLTNGH